MIQVTSAQYPCDIIVLPNFDDFWAVLDESLIDKNYFYLENEPIDDSEDEFFNNENDFLDQVQSVLDTTITYFQRNVHHNFEDIETAINNAKIESFIIMMITLMIILAIYVLCQNFLWINLQGKTGKVYVFIYLVGAIAPQILPLHYYFWFVLYGVR